jgi:hypothetical protein
LAMPRRRMTNIQRSLGLRLDDVGVDPMTVG